MTTIDDLGNVHDSAGKFAEKGQSAAAASTFPVDRDRFSGLREASNLIGGLEVREEYATTFADMAANPKAKLILIDTYSRSDKVYAKSFDAKGRELDDETFYVNDYFPGVPDAFEYDGDPIDAEYDDNGMYEGQLDPAKVRAYDADKDRSQTQERVFLATQMDLMNRGDARGYVFTRSMIRDEIDENPVSRDADTEVKARILERVMAQPNDRLCDDVSDQVAGQVADATYWESVQ